MIEGVVVSDSRTHSIAPPSFPHTSSTQQPHSFPHISHSLVGEECFKHVTPCQPVEGVKLLLHTEWLLLWCLMLGGMGGWGWGVAGCKTNPQSSAQHQVARLRESKCGWVGTSTDTAGDSCRNNKAFRVSIHCKHDSSSRPCPMQKHRSAG